MNIKPKWQKLSKTERLSSKFVNITMIFLAYTKKKKHSKKHTKRYLQGRSHKVLQHTNYLIFLYGCVNQNFTTMGINSSLQEEETWFLFIYIIWIKILKVTILYILSVFFARMMQRYIQNLCYNTLFSLYLHNPVTWLKPTEI